ncbi:hypothetical protein Tco_0319744 [Tanacetum coccineum]
MNDLESDDKSVDTPLVSPFPHSDNDSDDGEVLNELIEYETVGMLRHEKAINSFDGDDLAFQCMIRFRKIFYYETIYLDDSEGIERINSSQHDIGMVYMDANNRQQKPAPQLSHNDHSMYMLPTGANIGKQRTMHKSQHDITGTNVSRMSNAQPNSQSQKENKEIDVELCRKAHLLKDKQIPSVWVFDEAHLEKKWTRLRTCTKIHQEVLFSKRGDGITSTKRRRRDLFGDCIRDLAMTS